MIVGIRTQLINRLLVLESHFFAQNGRAAAPRSSPLSGKEPSDLLLPPFYVYRESPQIPVREQFSGYSELGTGTSMQSYVNIVSNHHAHPDNPVDTESVRSHPCTSVPTMRGTITHIISIAAQVPDHILKYFSTPHRQLPGLVLTTGYARRLRACRKERFFRILRLGLAFWVAVFLFKIPHLAIKT